tara:strand:+ start:2929 stop:3846 length:918 start_codon:yes stop_codon:yes gene_type:complete
LSAAVSAERPYLSLPDALLLLVVIIWGSNFSVVKVALESMPPLGFSAIRLVIAATVLLVVSRRAGFRMPAAADWRRLLALGLAGHCAYQLTFVSGLARTSVTNSSLIAGCLPVTVLLLNAASRDREPVGWLQWVGVGLAFIGLYLVVGAGAELSLDSLEGDLLVMASVWCWGWYTVGSRELLERYSPLQVTTCTMLIGTLGFLPFGVPSLLATDWTGVGVWAWVGLVASGVLAISLGHVLWYVGVQRLGGARTALYSNLIPVVAIGVAALTLREPIGTAKVVGAALVLVALALTRSERQPAPRQS